MAGSDAELSMRDDYTALNRQTYDRIADRYVEHQEHLQIAGPHSFSAVRSAFLGALPANALVADLGCGPAADGARIASGGHRVVGMDLSSGMLAVAAVQLADRVAQADMRAIPIRDGRLDGVWCAAALLHVPEPQTAQVLAEFRRITRPSGTLGLITAVDAASGFEVVPYAPDERRWFVYRRRDRLIDQVRRAGYSVFSEALVAGNRSWLTVLATAV